jgi:hypothetical protein
MISESYVRTQEGMGREEVHALRESYHLILSEQLHWSISAEGGLGSHSLRLRVLGKWSFIW